MCIFLGDGVIGLKGDLSIIQVWVWVGMRECVYVRVGARERGRAVDGGAIAVNEGKCVYVWERERQLSRKAILL